MELQRLIHSLSTVQNVQLIYYTSVAMLCKCICFKSDDLNAQMFCGDVYGNDSCDDDDGRVTAVACIRFMHGSR